MHKNSEKIKATFKIYKNTIPNIQFLFYLIFYMLVHKIEICIKSILDKKLQKAAIVRGSRALLAGA